MIRQLGADGFTPEPVPWDLCIVGAGAAGLVLASQFLDTGWRVIVLESGLRQPDEVGEELNSLQSVGLRHDGGRAGRVRAFGGTTLAWGGQLVPLRASELAARPWVPHSGWPLELEELQPYYRRVEELLRTEGPPYDERLLAPLGLAQPGFDAQEFYLRFSQWASLGRRNFAVLFRRRLQRSGNVNVVLDATATAVHCGASGAHCESVEVRSRLGTRAVVRAGRVVIACGGIETARLLLASPAASGSSVANRSSSGGGGSGGGSGSGGRGVANRSGLVGRFFQDHISCIAGVIEPASRRAVQNLFDPRYVGSTMFTLKVEPSDESMRRHRWLNAMGHVAFRIPDALGWMELKKIMRSMQAGRLEIPSMAECRALARGGFELARLILARALAKRRRSPDTGEVLLLIDAEQAPNPDSRVVLDEHTDALGMPKARLDWQVTELEYRTLIEFAQCAGAELARLGLGTVRLAGRPDFDRRDSLGAARDIYHHMGTARMSTTAEAGVTRPDLRCHDVDNLFIAGAAVFPTSGIANPTFTVLALTLRLADSLKASRAM